MREKPGFDGNVVEVNMIGLCDKMKAVTKQYRISTSGVQEV